MTLYMNIFAFKFMDVEIAGNVEDVADKLADKGFYRAKGIAKKGSKKGKEEVVKLDNLMLLKGSLFGSEAEMMLYMKNKDDIVTGFSIDFDNLSQEELEVLYIKLFNFFKEEYGMPSFVYHYQIEEPSVYTEEYEVWQEYGKYYRYVASWDDIKLDLVTPVNRNTITIYH